MKTEKCSKCGRTAKPENLNTTCPSEEGGLCEWRLVEPGPVQMLKPIAFDSPVCRAVLTFDRLPPAHSPQRLTPFVGESPVFEAVPQRLFRPQGLIVWGAPAGATLRVYIGINLEGAVSWSGIPARFFAMGDSFEQIAKLLDAGKEPPAWIEWPDVQVGHRAAIAFDNCPQDAPIELCMWGRTVYP